MKALHVERAGVGRFDPKPLFGRSMMRGTNGGDGTGIGAMNRAIPARRFQRLIDRVSRFAKANKAYSSGAGRRQVGKVVVSGD
jgi:hypothetical protein